jgi:proteic killer suppression protein
MINIVEISKRAEKSLRVVPKQVAVSFFLWKKEIEKHGVDDVRKIPGYHDEPLEGKLKGFARSVRLGKGFRAYYSLRGSTVKCLYVEEVNKHDYKEIERLFGL